MVVVKGSILKVLLFIGIRNVVSIEFERMGLRAGSTHLLNVPRESLAVVMVVI